jgi:hypothetical protein
MERGEQDESFAALGKLDSRDRDRQLRPIEGRIRPGFRGKTKRIEANEIVPNEQTPPEFEAAKRSPKRSPTIHRQCRNEGLNRASRTWGQAANMDVKLILAARLP